jgi:putative flippase GtrA
MALRLWHWLEGLGVTILGWFGLPAGLARQLIRFFAVGGLAAVTYVAIMALVVDGFGGRVLLGAFLAFVIATLVSFVGNALWSFGARPTPAKAAMFFAVNTVGLGLNMLIAWLLERAGVHYLLISLTVLIVVPLFNFAGHRLITFART